MNFVAICLIINLTFIVGVFGKPKFDGYADPSSEDALLQQSTNSQQAEKNISTNAAERFDGFISYRRANSKHLAMLLKVMLERQNISAYLDVEDLDGGYWEEQLLEGIADTPNFILVLSNGTLERCKGDFNYTDFLHREIRAAVVQEKRIIPVFDDFNFPTPDESELFTKEIKSAIAHQGVTWVHALVDQSLERIIDYMMAEDEIIISPDP